MKLVLVDDDKLVSASLKTILSADPEVEVLAIGNSGKDAQELYFKHHPDILLMDIRMDGGNGLDAGKQILAKDPNANILYLSTFVDEDYIRTALAIGAKGYILKQDFDSILPSLRAVASGQKVFAGEIVEKIPTMSLEEIVPYQQFDLTDKEFELVQKVAEGLSNKEISGALYLSEGTVRNYLTIILEKLDLRDRTQLAVFYYKNQWDKL
ncbi:MAG: response regulator transcription factor [Erysipelotrichaceae bacterium]|jgi:DNA-binding NarL/FixJ family response regulator|nr:response regulator transcription factor [Erysipelotrichaceae bacterium]